MCVYGAGRHFATGSQIDLSTPYFYLGDGWVWTDNLGHIWVSGFTAARVCVNVHGPCYHQDQMDSMVQLFSEDTLMPHFCV